MKKTLVSALLIMIVFAGNSATSSLKKDQKNPSNPAVQTMQELYKTTPFVLDAKRLALFSKFQSYNESMVNTTFNEYLISSEPTAVTMEQTIPMLYCYRTGFDKVLDEVKNTNVKKGTTKVWLLYNMGFVVKTSSGCFGIDINHRLALQLEPYLDFLLITHNHGDHQSKELMDLMHKHGKPVVSNFYTTSEKYYSKTPTTYKIGNFNIKTDISDHLTDPKMPDFVTVFRIEGGDDSGNFSMLHCGDSGFNPIHFTKVQGPVSLAVIRWAAERENRIFGTGAGQVQTDYAILSHLIELRHEPRGQASIPKTLKQMPNITLKHVLLPFWGESLTWKNGKLK